MNSCLTYFSSNSYLELYFYFLLFQLQHCCKPFPVWKTKIINFFVFYRQPIQFLFKRPFCYIQYCEGSHFKCVQNGPFDPPSPPSPPSSPPPSFSKINDGTTVPLLMAKFLVFWGERRGLPRVSAKYLGENFVYFGFYENEITFFPICKQEKRFSQKRKLNNFVTSLVLTASIGL